MRSPINIVGGFYKDPNKHWSAQDTLNWIPVKSERSGARTEWQFRDAPGVKPLVKLGVNSGGDFIEAGPGRCLRNVEGKLFAVAGNTLFQITNDLISIPYGTIPGVNRVSMAHNQYGSANQLLTVNGSAGYVFNTSTLVFEKITDTGYPGAFVADYVDGYLAQVESLGRYWFHSDLAEAREYNTLDQYEAEGDPDRIVTLHVAYREVLLFGADTIEPYVNAPRGSGIAPFQRAANTVIQCGCSAKFSPRNIAGVVPFLDDKRVVQYLQGYSVNRISTVGIEQALGECSREEISNAYAYTYEDRGHKIYYLTVPGRFTFGYDFLTQEWHRRATSGLPDLAFTDVAFWNGMWVALDRRYGRLYELDWGYKLDSCEPLVRERVTGVLSNNQNRVTVNELELLFNVGTAESVCQAFTEQPEGPLITGDAPDGVIGIEWGPYSYTVTGGTPPYTVTLRPDGPLPPGLGPISSAGTIPSGEPEEVGSYTFRVRATDSKGLFSEVVDTIEIGVTMYASRVAGTNENLLVTGAPYDWDQTTINVGIVTTGALVESRGGKVFVFTTSGYVVSHDNGASWQACSGIPSQTYCAVVYVTDKWIAVPQNPDNEVYVSSDGQSFSPVVYAGSAQLAGCAIAFGETVIVGRSNSSPSRISLDGGVTWGDCGLSAPVGPVAIARNPDSGAMVSMTANGSSLYSIRRSIDDGVTWGTVSNPVPGTQIVSVAFKDGLFMMVTATSECATSDDDGATWTVKTPIPYAMGGVGQTNEFVADTERFILATGTFIVTTVDGTTWETHNNVGARSIGIYNAGQ